MLTMLDSFRERAKLKHIGYSDGTLFVPDLRSDLPFVEKFNDWNSNSTFVSENYAKICFHRNNLNLPGALVDFLCVIKGVIVGDYVLDLVMRELGVLKTIATPGRVEVYIPQTSEFKQLSIKHEKYDAEEWGDSSQTCIDDSSFFDESDTDNDTCDFEFPADENGPQTTMLATIVQCSKTSKLGDCYAAFRPKLSILTSTLEFRHDSRFVTLKIRNFGDIKNRTCQLLRGVAIENLQKYQRLGFEIVPREIFQFTELPALQPAFGANICLWKLEPQTIKITSDISRVELNNCESVTIICKHENARVNLINCKYITIVDTMCQVFGNSGFSYDFSSEAEYLKKRGAESSHARSRAKPFKDTSVDAPKEVVVNAFAYPVINEQKTTPPPQREEEPW
jgi:hypothetical protein